MNFWRWLAVRGEMPFSNGKSIVQANNPDCLCRLLGRIGWPLLPIPSFRLPINGMTWPGFFWSWDVFHQAQSLNVVWPVWHRFQGPTSLSVTSVKLTGILIAHIWKAKLWMVDFGIYSGNYWLTLMCLLVLDAPSVDHFSKRWPPTCFNRWKNRFHPRLPWNLTGTEGETISMSWVSNAASRIITWLWVRLKTNYVTTGFWGYPICWQTHMNQGKETVVTVVILDKGDNLDSYEWKCKLAEEYHEVPSILLARKPWNYRTAAVSSLE